MADTIRWFIFRRESHAVDTAKRRLQTECGLVPTASFAPDYQGLTEGEWPEGVCQRCLVAIGSRQTDDEPIGYAKDRGYIGSRDLRGLTPLPVE
jgi:hypothetical protein